jgi:hypothetical protein
MTKVLINPDLIRSLISYIPSDAGPSVALVESVMQEISQKEPEVFSREWFPLDGNSQLDFFVKLALETGMVVLMSTNLITEVVYIKNPPESLAGKVIHFESPVKGNLDIESLLNIVAEEANKLKGK